MCVVVWGCLCSDWSIVCVYNIVGFWVCVGDCCCDGMCICCVVVVIVGVWLGVDCDGLGIWGILCVSG